MPKESNSGTAKSRRKSRTVRVWAEVGVTLAVTQDPPQFVKFTFGHERIAPNDTQETLEKYQSLVIESCEATVEKEVKRLSRIVRRASRGED